MALTSEEYALEAAGVDRISKALTDWLEGQGLERKTALRVRLTLEELLLRILEQPEHPKTVRLELGKRLGRPTLRLRYGGAPYDPTAAPEGEALHSDILRRLGLAPDWAYRGGENSLTLRLARTGGHGQLFWILCAVLGAIALGAAGTLLPEQTRTLLISALLEPAANAFLGLLNTFAGLLVFLTVSSGLFGVGDAASLGRVGKTMFTRILAVTLFTGVFALAVYMPLMGPAYGGGGSGGSALQAVSDMLFGILPKNPFRPFLEGNTMQIIVLAIFAGIALLVLGERARAVSNLVGELGSAVELCMQAVCSMIPLFVFFSLTLQIWSGATRQILNLWRPILIFVAANLLFTALELLPVFLRTRVSPVVVLRKVLPVFLISFTTASSMASYTAGTEICEKRLGIRKSLIDFGYPIGIVLYMPSTVLFYVLVPVYLAEVYSLQIGLPWMILCVLLAAILAVASPPIPGSALTCLGIILAQLDIPTKGMLVAVALNVVLDFVLTGFNVLFLQLELIQEAGSLGMLDTEALRKA